MKSAFTSILFLSFLFFTYSQNDQFTTKIREGTTWTLTKFDKKGKAQQHLKAKVDTVELETMKAEFSVDYSLEFHRKVRDNKTIHKEIEKVEVGRKSTKISAASYFGFPYKNDVSTYVVPELIEDFGIYYPNRPQVGDTLKFSDPYKFTSSVSRDGANYKREIKYELDKRIVTKKERIKIKAGTFDTYIIEEDLLTYANNSYYSTLRNKVWFVPGFGIVKKETYKKGIFSSKYNKLIGYYELTEYSY